MYLHAHQMEFLCQAVHPFKQMVGPGKQEETSNKSHSSIGIQNWMLDLPERTVASIPIHKCTNERT